MTSWLVEPLQTERLLLRPTGPGDEEWIIRLFTDPEVRRYLGGAMSESEARAAVQISGEWWGHFAVLDRERQQAIVSLSFENKHGFWEIAYELQRDFWDRGFATEAIKVALQWFFGATNEDEVSAVTQVANLQSCRLLERLGAHVSTEFTYRGALVRQYTFSRSMFGNIIKERLIRFVSTGTRLCEESVSWGGTLPLRITYYLSDELPPFEYVSSVRAMVFRNQSVLVLKGTNGHMHLLPGGRVEKGESMLETLRREILEETGWTVFGTKLLGFMHLHHLGAKPQNYEYPYPDFLWPIYLAEAREFVAATKIPDERMFESEFRSVEEVRKLPLDKCDLILLDAALKLRENPFV